SSLGGPPRRSALRAAKPWRNLSIESSRLERGGHKQADAERQGLLSRGWCRELDKTALNRLLQHRHHRMLITQHSRHRQWELVNDDKSTGWNRIDRWNDVDECDSRVDESAIAAISGWA